MDILENGADRQPMRRRTRFALLTLVAVAVLAAIALSGQAQRRQPLASPVIPSVPTPVVAALVDTGGGTTYRGEQDTKEFVLSVDLINFNRVPAQVTAGSAPVQPAFDRLVLAVLPAEPSDTATIETVAAAARTPLTIGARDKAQLVIAGRAVCAASPTPRNDFTILVNGEEKTVELPRFGGAGWVAEVIKELCPAR